MMMITNHQQGLAVIGSIALILLPPLHAANSPATATPSPDSFSDAGNAVTRVFNVREHGARGDGSTADTRAIQDSIDACSQAGGGRVLLPAGVYRSSTLRLRSGVDLHLAAGARLVGLADEAAYSGFTETDWLSAHLSGAGV